MQNPFKTLLEELRAIPQTLSDASAELKRLPSLTGTGMLAALNIIIHQFTIFVTPFLKITFGFLTVGLCGMLYGPMLTGMAGAATDILKYFIRNDGGFYFPGFTFNEFVAGFLYGLVLYRKPVTLGRVFAARLTVMLVVSMFLTPLSLSLMYGDAFIVLFSARIVKNLVMLPIETMMLYVVLKKVSTFALPRRVRQ